MLQQLKKIVLTQRSLFNSKSLADRIPKILLDVLIGSRKEKITDTGTSRMAGGSGVNIARTATKTKSTSSAKGNDPMVDKSCADSFDETNKMMLESDRYEMDKLVLVRIDPDLLKLMRRVQRFEQVSTEQCLFLANM